MSRPEFENDHSIVSGAVGINTKAFSPTPSCGQDKRSWALISRGPAARVYWTIFCT